MSKAIAILLDNSETSINGDFLPNRLEAQKIAANRLSCCVWSANKQSQVAVFTAASEEFGIRISFTSVSVKMEPVLAQIKSGGFLKLDQCIRQAIVAFHFAEPAQTHKIIVFVASQNDITPQNAEVIAEKCIKEKITLNFFVLGDSVTNSDLLKQLALKTNKNATFVELSVSKGANTALWDAVLKSEIGEENTVISLNDICQCDPLFASELRMALQIQNPRKRSKKNKP